MKIFFLASNSDPRRLDAKDLDGAKAEIGFVDAIQRKSDNAQVLEIMI
jgi:hypothetical protein